ncbi:glycosyltransferase family 2 protein [Parageobacillus thermoglucosidasius]|uniref:glycosyltransferase family 2 protein n=1 Tax=Parageobacillus thermoglucosidasius TaxID=1426 RepID=UPI0001D18984|nr:glycosyltransferase [Parageobacillus thermoglucosidasius]KYD11840.1 Dolichol-phosphate mannosyltransferase in lipid-linked oligosaccharide synthesis cluster [Anoxybacillus flavithermus]REK57164.1 MAG: glycosyltransferase family 2 protein [Geobacillus sp.]AEH49561.1 glycosyl transferase family 2 [Parageobacillus thermoglucosidasius C56-YS93]EID42613.1 glycosyl transferase, family 2 [Parageobacillus thermoglucosidasius TNO-09.020]OAO88124.1 Dolichol-phosphate mannosyltransferase in lipid-link
MNTLFIVISSVFSIVLLYYSVLTVFGLYYRLKRKKRIMLDRYPSVDVLIPAHNEGKVIGKTLEAMVKLQYPGELHIYVLNDNSEDDTGMIADAFAERFKHVHHIRVPQGFPKGKSRVLNYGLEISGSEYFAVYDADNQPEPQALTLLVEAAETTVGAAGAVGYVRTVNEQKNWLTRMISLEFQVFQLLMQAGRWFLFRTGSLTGTNMLVKRSVIEEVGNYDVYALAEDAELTLRITRAGGLLPIVPESVTWEQEPEKLDVLIRQRTRWLQGNLYVIEKMLSSFDYYKGRMLVHTLQQLLVYVLFLMFLMVSDCLFIAGIFGYVSLTIPLPMLMIWYVSYLIYTVQLFSAQAAERTFSPLNLFIGFILYFTYAQLFILLFFRSLFYYLKAKRRNAVISWEKTIRF